MKDHFYCLDYSDELIIKPPGLQFMGISLISCNKVSKYGLKVNKECIANKE